MNRKNEETCWALTLHLSCYAFKSQFYAQQIPVNSFEDKVVKYRFFCSFIPGKYWNWLKLWHTIGIDTKTMSAKFHYCSSIFVDSRGKYVFRATLHSARPIIRLSFAGSCHNAHFGKSRLGAPLGCFLGLPGAPWWSVLHKNVVNEEYESRRVDWYHTRFISVKVGWGPHIWGAFGAPGCPRRPHEGLFS